MGVGGSRWRAMVAYDKRRTDSRNRTKRISRGQPGGAWVACKKRFDHAPGRRATGGRGHVVAGRNRHGNAVGQTTRCRLGPIRDSRPEIKSPPRSTAINPTGEDRRERLLRGANDKDLQGDERSPMCFG